MDEAMKEIEGLANEAVYRARQDMDYVPTVESLLAAVRRLASPPSADGRGLREALQSAEHAMRYSASALHNGGGTGHEEVRLLEAADRARAALSAPPASADGLRERVEALAAQLERDAWEVRHSVARDIQANIAAKLRALASAPGAAPGEGQSDGR